MTKTNILVSLLLCIFVAPSYALKYFNIAENSKPQHGNKKVVCFVISYNEWCCPHPEATRAVQTYKFKYKTKLEQQKTIYMSDEEYNNPQNWLENKCGNPGLTKRTDF